MYVYDNHQLLKVDGFDNAVIGIEEDSMRLIYSVAKCIEILEDSMDSDKALEHFSFNVHCAYVGDNTPIWCWDYF